MTPPPFQLLRRLRRFLLVRRPALSLFDDRSLALILPARASGQLFVGFNHRREFLVLQESQGFCNGGFEEEGLTSGGPVYDMQSSSPFLTSLLAVIASLWIKVVTSAACGNSKSAYLGLRISKSCEEKFLLISGANED